MGAREARQAAIVGIGQTAFSKKDERSELQLAAEAANSALDDAGLKAADVDGMITYTLDPTDEIGMIRCLGVENLAFTTRLPGGGAAAASTIHQAMAAVTSGVCDVVLVWRSINQGVNYRYGKPQAGGALMPGGGTGSLIWCMPFGAQAPATWAALAAQRYMETFGVTNQHLAPISVVQRKYAATNPAALFYGKPITLQDHQQSKWIVEPVLRLLDCCQENAGAVALVVTSLERARDLRQVPVRIVAAAQSIPFNVEVISNYYHEDLTVMPEAVGTARRLYAQSELTAQDIQVAQIYDAFTPQVLMQLEAFGFCGKGEAKDFVAAGNLELNGLLPVNTHGGLIGEAYIHGMNTMAEGVRQVRGTAVNQVRNVQHALVSSAMSAAILGRA